MTDLQALYSNPVNFTKLSTAELFAIDFDEIEKIQLHHFKRRFREFKGKIAALGRLAEDVEIDEITSFDDLASVAFPHTMYKSYSVADVDNGRWERMTQWLQAFTAHDLSGIDVSGCASMDEWMDALEAKTPLRPSLSSGTSGKISIWPRSTIEEVYFIEYIYRLVEEAVDLPGFPLRDGKLPYLCAWPAAYGRHNYPIMFRLLRDKAYAEHPERVITLGDAFMGAGELWLAGKLRRAESLGEKIELTEREKILIEKIKAQETKSDALWDGFIDRAVIQQRGKRVLLFSFWIQLYQFAQKCAERGVKIEWSPDSVIYVTGGTKGFTFPDNFMDVINATCPFTYPDRYREGYGMSETTAIAILCPQGHYHPLPWGIKHLTDPDTGKSLPRKGVQRGRLMVFDLLPTTYWSGTASGDEVTIDWDGSCGCGRKGPVIHKSIARLADRRGGDDKITCARTPDAYRNLEEFVLG